jgi:hypothetical protein
MSCGRKRKSSSITSRTGRASNRVMLRAVGFHDAELHLPMIGVLSSTSAAGSDRMSAAAGSSI